MPIKYYFLRSQGKNPTYTVSRTETSVENRTNEGYEFIGAFEISSRDLGGHYQSKELRKIFEGKIKSLEQGASALTSEARSIRRIMRKIR